MNTPEQDWQDRAMSYSLDDDEAEEMTQLQERDCCRCTAYEVCGCDCHYREPDEEERERLKQACFAGLLALGLLPRSLCVDFVRREQA